MVMSECLSIGSLYSGILKGQVCSLAYEWETTWRWPTFT